MKKIYLFFSVFILILIISASYPGRRLSVSAPEYTTEENDGSSSSQEPRFIALTFDDGPHPIYTPMLLDGLAERNIKASFFLIGDNINGNEEIVQRMYKEGHLIGNHTSAHVLLTSMSENEACREIEETNQKIYEITKKRPLYIRPPFGSWSEDLECLIPMETILWNIDPLDWKVQDKNAIVKHVIKYAKNGGIILLHDSYKTSVQAALEIVDTLQAEGYTFVTAEELVID